MKELFLGIDISTQSITATVLDINSKNGKIVFEHSLSYTNSKFLLYYGIDKETKILSRNKKGEAMQPPLMFLAALDLICDILKSNLDCSIIKAISISAQQHGHVYLGNGAKNCFKKLLNKHSSLVDIFDQDNVFSFPYAPIWMMSASEFEANKIRELVGGAKSIQRISGSNSPSRFTGAVIKYIARNYPKEYKKTNKIHLLSSFITGIFTANYNAPIDWRNAAGMTLMDYHKKCWSEKLASAVSEIGSSQEILSKLPSLGKATDIVGRIAPYFVEKYKSSKDCLYVQGVGIILKQKYLFKEIY